MSSENARVVLAISGGVDSVVLLDRYLQAASVSDTVVAHVDHGIRNDSADDARFVETLAKKYGVRFESITLDLGTDASEESARQARYSWLFDVMKRYDADCVITAHHQDDVIETIIYNLLRGTRWKGLCSLRTTPRIVRPLLKMSKAEIVAYAIAHNLTWHEDSTNDDSRYSRNYIRQVYVPRLSASQRGRLVALYDSQCALRDHIDDELSTLLSMAVADDEMSRYWLMCVSDIVASEMIQRWLGHGLMESTVQRIRHFAATAQSGAICDVENGIQLMCSTRQLVVKPPRI